MISQLILKIFNNIWPMLAIFMVAICLLRFFYLQNHREKFCFHKEFWYLFSIVYMWLLFEILTMTELNSSSGMNLVPFSEILRYDFGSKMFNYNVIGNMLIFLPFGYLIGTYVNPKKVWPVLITTLLTSTAIEFVQLKIGRSFDIDDIILNVVGGLIGYLLYIGISAISRHLPDFFRSDLFNNILCILLVLLFAIYICGYWGVIF